MTTKQRLVLALLLVTMIMAACKQEPEQKKPPKPELTGTVSITGTAQVGETMTANVVGGNGTAGKFTYQWTRTPDGGEALTIIGADGATYLVTEADLDHTLGAIVGNQDTKGTISGAAAGKVGPDPATLPKDQSATLSNLFGEGLSTTVTGNLTDAEWTGIAGKIETALNGAFGNAPTGPAGATYKNRFRRVFGEMSTNIEVVKTSEYNKWKTTDENWDILYLNFDGLNDNLQTSITDAVISIATTTPGMAKVMPANNAVRVANAIVPKYTRAMQLRDNRVASRMARQRIG